VFHFVKNPSVAGSWIFLIKNHWIQLGVSKTSKRTRSFAGCNLTSQLFENQMVINQNWTLLLRTMAMKPAETSYNLWGVGANSNTQQILDFTTASNLKEITKKLQLRTLVTVQSDWICWQKNCSNTFGGKISVETTRERENWCGLGNQNLELTGVGKALGQRHHHEKSPVWGRSWTWACFW
jgi:hypothetical protein